MDLESKPYYKIGEVCEMTGTQPYVLRFWESEFPTLAPEKNRSGQRIYRKRDIDLIQRIKTLLYEKEYTIAGARKVLEAEAEAEDLGDGDEAAGGWTERGEGHPEAAPGMTTGARAGEGADPGASAHAGPGASAGASAGEGADTGAGAHAGPAGLARADASAAAGLGSATHLSRDPRRAARDEQRAPELPFRASHSPDAQLEAEVKNLRAKLARAEAELKAILASMDRHDQM